MPSWSGMAKPAKEGHRLKDRWGRPFTPDGKGLVCHDRQVPGMELLPHDAATGKELRSFRSTIRWTPTLSCPTAVTP